MGSSANGRSPGRSVQSIVAPTAFTTAAHFVRSDFTVARKELMLKGRMGGDEVAV